MGTIADTVNMASKGPQVIDISKLNLEQLTQLKNQLDQELTFFNESLQQLKIAQMKFTESGEYVEKDIAGTKDYFSRKVKLVTEQMEKIQKIATEKSKLREVVMDIMEVQLDKQLAVIAQQQQAQ